jgi:hypothetical protein
MGKKTEIIPKSEESIFMNLQPTLGIEVREYPSVLPQQTMHISDEIV